MTLKSAAAADKVIGANARRLRVVRGFTQQETADHCDISFQQIQKYESGTNRISAPRLHELSQLFECGVSDFFEGVGGEAPRGIPSDALGLVRDYAALDSTGKAAVRAVASKLKGA